MLIEWDDSYAVEDSIDEQHRKLFDILNDIFRCLRSGPVRARDRDHLTASLRDYCRHHFTNEEALMESVGYPGVERHRVEHARFSAKVEEFAAAPVQADAAGLLDLLAFLDNWLISHIINSDKRFGHFLRERDEP
ncbi:MAG: hemerythrin family protein [Desulfovibrionaceae bacterium]|jgi:hemerythrin-like metal-binding protein|nr:hemerythrin family protein [Desulfovibrionaceae bacterium]